MTFAAMLLAASAFATAPPAHQGHRSLTDPDDSRLLFAQALTIPIPQLDPPPVDRRELQARDAQIQQLRNSVRSLTEALALANNEAEVFKRQATELSLRLEALGVAGLEGDPSKIEQRLLAAVRDLRVAQERREQYESQLMSLTEAIQILIATTDGIDAQLRMRVETEIRKTNQLLGAPVPQQPRAVEATLTDALVSDVKPDLALVIANIGAKQGVRVGMPFQVWRDNLRVGDVRVVDVRDHISGAIIQSLESETNPIQKGDRLRVDAQR